MNTIPFNQLPSFAGTLSGEDEVVSVIGNVGTFRVRISDIKEGFVSFVDTHTDIPADQAAISWDAEGLYTFTAGWGKTPRYTNNWDDLDASTRFLLVNKDQSLSPAEQEQGRINLGFDQATTERAGLVFLAAEITKGSEGVVTAGMLDRYLGGTFTGAVRFRILPGREQIPPIAVPGVIYLVRNAATGMYEQYAWSYDANKYVKVGESEIRGLEITQHVIEPATGTPSVTAAPSSDAVAKFVLSSSNTYTEAQTFASGIITSRISLTGEAPTSGAALGFDTLRLGSATSNIVFGLNGTNSPELFARSGALYYRKGRSEDAAELATKDEIGSISEGIAGEVLQEAKTYADAKIAEDFEETYSSKAPSVAAVKTYVDDAVTASEQSVYSSLTAYVDSHIINDYSSAATDVAMSAAATQDYVDRQLAFARTDDVRYGADTLVPTVRGVRSYAIDKDNIVNSYSEYSRNVQPGTPLQAESKVLSLAGVKDVLDNTTITEFDEDVTFNESATFNNGLVANDAVFLGPVYFNSVPGSSGSGYFEGEVRARSLRASRELTSEGDAVFNGTTTFSGMIDAIGEATFHVMDVTNEIRVNGVPISKSYSSLYPATSAEDTAVYNVGQINSEQWMTLMDPATNAIVNVAYNQVYVQRNSSVNQYLSFTTGLNAGSKITVNYAMASGGTAQEEFTVADDYVPVVLQVTQFPDGTMGVAWVSNIVRGGGGGESIAPVPEPIPESGQLRYKHVYRAAVTASLDLSAITVGTNATVELWLDYTAGSVQWPAFYWIDGTSSASGDHDVPPSMTDVGRYHYVLRNEGGAVFARMAYVTPIPQV